ncbi:MAG TPA: hypothetical protein VK841_01555, partial [Polyangiaceae bacterium]|nr:hypothetical protein [Polyangiaceae bacterium]
MSALCAAASAAPDPPRCEAYRAGSSNPTPAMAAITAPNITRRRHGDPSGGTAAGGGGAAGVLSDARAPVLTRGISSVPAAVHVARSIAAAEDIAPNPVMRVCAACDGAARGEASVEGTAGAVWIARSNAAASSPAEVKRSSMFGAKARA